MARIFITGSADGLGQMAASALIAQGHRVVLHARNKKRAREAATKVKGAEDVLICDLSGIAETKKLAADVNAMGSFDAIIHNAGIYQVPLWGLSVDGLPLILAVNTIAPYILTCLIRPPRRLIYLSSGMHLSGDSSLKGLQGDQPKATYSDSKLHNLILAKAVARKCHNVISNAVDPGWVATKMGGAGATDDLEKGFQTQVWLAVSEEPEALLTGRYLHHRREANYATGTDDTDLQDRFVERCAQISGVDFPVKND